ncbi:toll/interleukin-1 receptor domain-containing protein [Aquihabitans sp. McL0605]|uniref:toll/interleukin-1 receptor domain-containing protein n=1 Tax=Aquihabitans sp. McL0605 TaxID=3415671 RepID=UPI003CEB813D
MAPPDQSLGSSFVFISYKHKDRAAALKLKEQLRGEAFSVWIDSDQLKAGTSWNRAIQGAIEHSRSWSASCRGRSRARSWSRSSSGRSCRTRPSSRSR